MGDFAEQQRKQYYNTVTVKLGYNKWLHYFQTNPLYVVFLNWLLNMNVINYGYIEAN